MQKHENKKQQIPPIKGQDFRSGFTWRLTIKALCIQFCSSLDLRATRAALIDLSYFTMAARQLCKEMARCPLKALFFFPEEELTGIAPTRLIVEKGLVL